jgi:deoxycytidine triphosphate deaminase
MEKKNNMDQSEHERVEIPKGILTIKEIKELKLIQVDEGQHFDNDCYSNASYDFRLGNEYFSPKLGKRDVSRCEPDISCPYKKDSAEPKTQFCNKDNDVLKIKPFTSVVFSTYEKVKTPNNVAGRFDLMVKWALQGLILQVGTQIEPGYEGRLFGLLHNFSKKEICIPTGSRLLTAEFSYTIEDTKPIIKKGRKKIPITELQQFLDFYPVIDGSLEHYLSEINRIHTDIKDSVEKTKQDTEKVYKEILEASRYKGTISLSIFAAIIVLTFSIGIPLIVTKLTFNRDDYPYPKSLQIDKNTRKTDSLNDIIFTIGGELKKIEKKVDSLKKTR